MNEGDEGKGAVGPRAPSLTLWQALRFFARQQSPKLMATLLVMVGVLRGLLGNFSWVDIAIALGLTALHPLSEWMIHVYLLHLRPRKWGRWILDTRAGLDHRKHHESPHEVRWWFMPRSTALVGFVVISSVARVCAPTKALAVTVMLTVLVLALVYEWTHYLCHSTYRGRSRWFKRCQRLHRLHHFKNEHYWFGVTMHAGDRMLGTIPDPRHTPTSETCRLIAGLSSIAESAPNSAE